MGFSLDLSAQDYITIFRTGSYGQLSAHLADNLDLEIKRDKSTVSKAEAIRLIRQRLNQFNPTEWETIHSGESEEKGANYFILKATNASGEGIRIFLHVKRIDGRQKVVSIRFRRAL